MTSYLFDLPIELQSIIFSSTSLRDISRLRQCCSAWKNNLQDLSFMEVLDFSYSPDITIEQFNEFLDKRIINKTQNNIEKVTFAHVRNLNEDSLKKLLAALPRLKDVRIRHSFINVPAFSILSILFQQQNLECIVYVQQWDMKAPGLGIKYSINCTKLKRCKIGLHNYYKEGFSLADMLLLIESNPALRHDADFLGEIASKREFYNSSKPETSSHPLLDIAFASNDLRVYESFWKQMTKKDYESHPSYAFRLLNRTIQLLHDMPSDQRQSNEKAHAICYAIIHECENKDDLKKIVQENEDWLKPLAAKHESKIGDKFNQERQRMAQWLEKFKKRPFYKQAKEEYFKYRMKSLNAIKWEPLLKEKYGEDLKDTMDCFSSVLKKLPEELCLLQALWMLQQGKAREAFDYFLAAMEPQFDFRIKSYYGNINMQALCGAYHVAKDYLKNPDLLDQLPPEHKQELHYHFESMQPCFDKGLCTRSLSSWRRYFVQYNYACYTCDVKGLCYACAKTCHADHETVFMAIVERVCDDKICEDDFPEGPYEDPR